MQTQLHWAGCTNHFDVKTGVRSARVEFVSGEQVMTGEGLQPHTRLTVTVDGDTANTMQRLKYFVVMLVPETPVVEPMVSAAGNGGSPDLTAAEVQGKEQVITIGPSARKAAAAKAAEKPAGN
jgi:hypothetical protein